MTSTPDVPQAAGTGGRDLTACTDQFGNIAVGVTIGGGPGAQQRTTGASHVPAAVAAFLRDLAGDIERVNRALS